MSVPYNLLQNAVSGHIPASQRVPTIARPFLSEQAAKTLDIVERFVEEECIPADKIIEDMKKRAQELGLWNIFLPKAHFKEGAGFSNLEYGLMAEYLGKSRIASEAITCAAPDTGNMEVVAKYGSEAQKRKWLDPFLQGKIRSASS